MKLSKYQRKAMSTRDYPITSVWTAAASVVSAPYIGPAMELASEAGELIGELKKAHRKDGGEVTMARLEAIKLEIGDTLWALAAVADSVGLSLDDCARANLQKLSARAEKGTIHSDGGER
jgi:NTP pyrophosphatase (non-canonical NTP hydrolase)